MAMTVQTSDAASVDLVSAEYEPRVAAARERYVTARAHVEATDPAIQPEQLDRFLIEFCARGVQMTEPVDRWITRAGRRCTELGMVELGDALQRHAVHEAGHHLMMIEDTRALVAAWNRRERVPLDADTLLGREPSPGVHAWVDLHEHTVTSEQPWGQLAIEYEIERLSTTSGPKVIGNVAAVCGVDRVAALSFLTEHIAVDEGHTVFNRRQLNQLLAEQPDLVAPLAAAGSAALDAHACFVEDCMAVAR